MQRMGKTAITGILVLLLAVDPAAASRGRWFGGGCCRPARVYCCPAPVYCGPPSGCCYEGATEVLSEPWQDVEMPQPSPPAPPMEDTGRPELPAESLRPNTGTQSPSDAVPTPGVRSIPQPPTDTIPTETPTPDATAVPDLLPDETPVPPAADQSVVPDLLPDSSPTPDAAPSDTLPDLIPDEAPAVPDVMPDEAAPRPATEGTDSLDELFKDSSAVEPKADDAVTPASAETPVLEQPKSATADDLDSLFEEPAAAPATADESPAVAEPMNTAAEPAGETFDLLPETGAPTEPAAGDMSNATDTQRTWTDNTGHFQVRAKLLVILDGKVRLLKETGRTTTVPFERLSKSDRAYVEHQAQLIAVSQAGAEY